MPTATADSLDNADGTDMVATGHVGDDGAFKIWRLQADTWTLGYEAETVVTDAGDKLVWEATVDPTEIELSSGEKVRGVEYTITSVSCEAP